MHPLSERKTRHYDYTHIDSLVRSEIALLREALKDPDNKKFIFLLESTPPGQSFKDTYSAITHHPLYTFDFVPTIKKSKQVSNKGAWFVLDRAHAHIIAENDLYIEDALRIPEETKSTALSILSLIRRSVLSLPTKISSPIDEKKRDLIFSLEFERAMGKHEIYSSPFFELCFKQPNGWQYINFQYNPKKVYNLFKSCYEKHLTLLTDRIGSLRIPQVIHQIWIGDKPFPERYKKWQKTWQSLPGWRYKLWTDKEVKNLSLINQKLYNEEQNFGARADILRLEILYQEGGIYVDTDFECIRPETFDILNRSFDFYAGLHPIDCEAILINNAIIGSIKGHPIIKACIDKLKEQTPSNNDLAKIVKLGPGLLSEMALEHMNQGYKDILFPASVFYPLGVYEMKKPPLASLSPEDPETFEIIKKLVLKPESIALHWWEGSWTH